MKINKITSKNDQVWLSISNREGKYVGTWHIIDPDCVEWILENRPDEIHFSWKQETKDYEKSLTEKTNKTKEG